MISRTLKHRFVRPLVYLVCALMVLAGDPILALDQNVRIVPGDDRPDWFETWTQGETYAEVWNQAGDWSGDAVSGVHHRLDSWWDGSWEDAWNLLEASMAEATGPRRPKPVAATGPASASSMVAGQVPVFAAVAVPQDQPQSESETSVATDEELEKLAETDSLARPGEAPAKTITKAEPMPNAEGLKVGGSSFRPPKELIQQLNGKADLDQVPLIPGLNLLSLPEEPASTDPATVFGAIGGAYTKIWVYEHCDADNPWKILDPNDSASSDLTEVDHTNGFWLEATSPVDLPSEGTLPATTSIELCPGWNLIGYPAAQPRHVTNALHSIEGKYLRVFGYDASDADDPWEVYSVDVPEWANDLVELVPGRGYWVLATEATTLTIANEGPDPIVEITSPDDLGVVTDFTDVIGTVQSPILDSWRLTYERIGETEPVEIASGVAPVVEGGVLGTFDPTLLINGLYELKLEAIDLEGNVVEDSIAVAVEGNMKIGHFTLSFVDLAIPLSGLDIEIVRTYDSRRKDELLDFGYGWSLDIRQGSYQNNRPPGDGWQIVNPGGLFGLPCSQTIETKSHLTTIRLSDQEIYRFRLKLTDVAILLEGCQARAIFEWVGGPLPGSTLEVLGNDWVIYENGTNHLLDQDLLEEFVPNNVKLTTRDGRIFHLNLEAGVTHLEDLNGNAVDITVDGITHSSGQGIEFLRDSAMRISAIQGPGDSAIGYEYDTTSDLSQIRNLSNRVSNLDYYSGHLLREIVDPRGISLFETTFDESDRLVQVDDARGGTTRVGHDLENRREIVNDSLGREKIFVYDQRGNVVLEMLNGTVLQQKAYDNTDRLTWRNDALGRTAQFHYDTQGNLQTLINAEGHETTWTYDGRGHILSVSDPMGRVQSMSWDARGNLRSVTDPTGETVAFEYDDRGNLVAEISPTGERTERTYDDAGRKTTETDALGQTTTFQIHDTGLTASKTVRWTNADGVVEDLVTRYSYDASGNLTKVTTPSGQTEMLTYDSSGNLVRRVDYRGGVTDYDVDAYGALIGVTFDDQSSWHQEVGRDGRVMSIIDRLGGVTRLQYDDQGRLSRRVLPSGAVETWSYDAAGQVVAQTLADGGTVTFEWTDGGRLAARTGPNGYRKEMSYNAAGELVEIEDALGRVTRFERDGLGRVIRKLWPDGSTTSSRYDALGQLIASIDELGATTSFEYDALGRLLRVTDPRESQWHFAYDEMDNLVAQTDPKERVTRMTYDGAGRLLSRTLPDGSRKTWEYDSRGLEARLHRLSGATTDFSYNDKLQLTRKAYSDGLTVEYSYDDLGRLSQTQSDQKVTDYTYDELGRLTATSVQGQWSTTYAFDAANRLTGTTLSVGAETWTTGYEHDAAGRLYRILEPGGGLFQIGYNAAGERAWMQYPNGVIQTFQRDDRGRITGFETALGSDRLHEERYTLDAAGGLVSVTESTDTTRSFQYDANHQLVSVEEISGGSVGEWRFRYDEVGNRTSQTVGIDGELPMAEAGSFDARDRLTVLGATAYSWDVGGRLTLREGPEPAEFAWAADDSLQSVDLGAKGRVEYEYLAEGLRYQTTRKSVGGESSVKSAWSLGLSLPQIQAEIPSDESLTYYVLAGHERLASHQSGGEKRYFLSDPLVGSVKALFDESGSVTDRYRYAPFGELQEHEGESTNPFLFAGQRRDSLTGLYDNRARWLDPSVGRFISPDPFEGFSNRPATLHRYQYAGNDSVNKVDPTGLLTTANALVVSLGVAVLAGIASVAFGSSFRAARVEVDPVVIEGSAWSNELNVLEGGHYWMARTVFAHQATNVHLIFGETRTKRSPWGKNIADEALPTLLQSLHRKGSVPLVYLDEVYGEIGEGEVGASGYPKIKFNLSEKTADCFPSRVRGVAIGFSTVYQPIVTAHELGHAIGCLPDRNLGNDGEEWMLMWNDREDFVDTYGKGVTLEDWEVRNLRRWARRIP